MSVRFKPLQIQTLADYDGSSSLVESRQPLGDVGHRVHHIGDGVLAVQEVAHDEDGGSQHAQELQGEAKNLRGGRVGDAPACMIFLTATQFLDSFLGNRADSLTPSV